MSKLPANLHRWVYFFGLSVVTIGLPLSEFLMSIGQIILLLNWFAEGALKEKLKRFWQNKIAVLVSSVLIMHLLGLLYTSDFEYAFKDIRIKAPLLILPFVIASSQTLSQTLFNWLMAIFVAAVAIGTFVSMGVYFGFIHPKFPVLEIRDISIFISHIRFSLLICFSIFTATWYLYVEPSWIKKIGLSLLIGWLTTFLLILDALTGVVVLVLVALIVLVYNSLVSENKFLRNLAKISLIGLLIWLVFYSVPLVRTTMNHQMHYTKAETRTKFGGPYESDTLNPQRENGYQVWVNNSWDELETAWNKRSAINFYGRNDRGDEIMFTIIRYMSSKGLKKDAEGLSALDDNEIKLIEDGIANINYVGKSPVTVRIMETMWELMDFRAGGNVNGHSTAMRLEFWRAGLHILKKNPLIGVGTGDIRNVYASTYDEIHSPLNASHRLRSHNQFLSIAVAFGCLGLAWFLFALCYPFVHFKMWRNYFYFTFILIATLSFFNEDTLETQPGVTFFAFFNALLLFGVEWSGVVKSGSGESEVKEK